MLNSDRINQMHIDHGLENGKGQGWIVCQLHFGLFGTTIGHVLSSTHIYNHVR